MGVSLTVGLLTSETTPFQRRLEPTQFGQTPLERWVAFRDLPSKSHCETESILKVLCLGISDEPFKIKSCEVEQQPRKRLDQPGLQIIACKRR